MKQSTITIPATKGKQTIAEAKDVFYYIDSDFKNWGTDVPEKPTKEMNLDVTEMTQNGTYKDIFTNPEKICLTQEQIVEFCKNHKEELTQSYYTLFLFKVGDNFFVADVGVLPGGLSVDVNQFSFDDVWDAENGGRFVVPQLTSSNLDSDTLTPSSFDPSDLESRVTAIENWINGVKNQLL